MSKRNAWSNCARRLSDQRSQPLRLTVSKKPVRLRSQFESHRAPASFWNRPSFPWCAATTCLGKTLTFLVLLSSPPQKLPHSSRVKSLAMATPASRESLPHTTPGVATSPLPKRSRNFLPPSKAKPRPYSPPVPSPPHTRSSSGCPIRASPLPESSRISSRPTHIRRAPTPAPGSPIPRKSIRVRISGPIV